MKRKSQEELGAMWKEYKANGGHKLKNELMECYLPLVRYVAERIKEKLPHSVDVDDLASSGIFGLMDAIDRFDLSRGIKFETYCTNRIRGAILDELRAMDMVPRLVRARAGQLERAFHQFTRDHGRAPSDVELAKVLKISLADYDVLVQEVTQATMVSLNRNLQEGSGANRAVSGAEILQDTKEADPDHLALKKELVDYISSQLSKKERLILILYYYEGLTLKEIGRALELSESRICQLHAKILLRLRTQLRRKAYEPG